MYKKWNLDWKKTWIYISIKEFTFASAIAVWYLGSGKSPINRKIVIHTARAAYTTGEFQYIW